MINRISLYFFRWLFLLALQVLIIDRLHLPGIFNPIIYPVFILLLPLEMSSSLIIVLAFFLGLSIDIFSNTAGLNAAASVCMAFLRPFILQLIEPPSGYEGIDEPRLSVMGFRWFLLYVSFLFFIHHIIYFFLETLSANALGFMFLKLIVSTIISVFLVMLGAYLFYSRRKRIIN
jgi:hypothetical protein